MTVKSFQIDERFRLKAIAPEAAAKAYRCDGATVWLDLQTSRASEIHEWLDKLEVKGLSRRLCLEGHDRSGFYPSGGEILFVIPVLVETPEPRELDYLGCFCRERLLLTLHRKPVWTEEQLSDVQEAHLWLSEHSIAGLVSAMMIDGSLVCLRQATDLRTSILALEDRMDDEPDTVEAEHILAMRSGLVTVSAVVSDQLPVIEALNASEKPFFSPRDGREYLHCAMVNLQAADRILDRQDRRVDALRSGFQMYGQEKTNRRLNALTILSAIFMPITLLAGIWGMNFEAMPELKYTYSYPLAIASMVLIGVGMYLFFRRDGWFE